MAGHAEAPTSLARSSDLPSTDAARQDEPALDMIDARFPLDPEAFEDALENSQDCIAIVDLQGHVLYMNLPGLWQMGLDDPAQRTIEWPQLWSKDAVDLAECSIELAKCGRRSRFIARRSTFAGAVKWWDVVASPVFDPRGEPKQMLCISRDVTDLKNAEGCARDTIAARDMMLLEANHRIKNSLAAVASLLSLQASRSGDEGARACLLDAQARIGVVAEIHRRLYVADAHDRVDLGDYLAEVARGIVATLSVENRILLWTACEHGINLPADEALAVAQIAAELITNCAKHAFGPQGGTVRMQFAAHAAQLLLRIDDDGRGLPGDFPPSANSGLGMHIVAKLVEQLHGTLQAERAQPGAHFVVTLPGISRSAAAFNRDTCNGCSQPSSAKN